MKNSRTVSKLIGVTVFSALAIEAVGFSSVMAQQNFPPYQTNAGTVMNQNLRDFYVLRAAPWLARPTTDEDVTGTLQSDEPLIQGVMRDPYGRIVPIPGVPAPTFNLP